MNGMDSKIAYFTMEIGLTHELPTYSGGLGVLAGDTIKSAADLKLPMVVVTLLHQKGYFEQTLTEQGWQEEHDVLWDHGALTSSQDATTQVSIEGRDVTLRAWRYDVVSPTGGVIPVFFLDSDVEGNDAADRRLTDQLYAGDETHRLKQEIILGIGGVHMLDVLDVEVQKYHMNEGRAGTADCRAPSTAETTSPAGVGRRVGPGKVCVHEPYTRSGRPRPVRLRSRRACAGGFGRLRVASRVRRRGWVEHDLAGAESEPVRQRGRQEAW